MARKTTTKKTRGKKKGSVRIDMSNVGKSFEPNQEYLVTVAECELKEGSKAPYFSLKLEGTEDFKGAYMYHNASTSEDSLWRLRPLMEALGMDIPDGPLDISEDDWVGKSCMCSTILDRYDGGSKIRPDEFWEDEEGAGSSNDDDDDDDGEEEEDNSFIDDLSNKDLAKLKDEFELKGRGDSLRKKLREVDVAELREACDDLDIEIEEEEEEEEKPKSKRSSKKRSSKKKKSTVTEDDIQDMSEEELEALIEEHELDVDLDDHKTLRKKKNAVIDAAEEAEILED